MDAHNVATPIIADHFSFDPGEYAWGDDQARIQIPPELMGLFGSADLTRGDIEQLVEVEVWNERPHIVADLLIDLLDRIDGDVDGELAGDEGEEDEPVEDSELQIAIGGLAIDAYG